MALGVRPGVKIWVSGLRFNLTRPLAKCARTDSDHASGGSQDDRAERDQEQVVEAGPHEVLQDERAEVGHATADKVVMVLGRENSALLRCPQEEVVGQDDHAKPGKRSDQGALHRRQDTIADSPGDDRFTDAGDQQEREHGTDHDHARRRGSTSVEHW